MINHSYIDQALPTIGAFTFLYKGSIDDAEEAQYKLTVFVIDNNSSIESNHPGKEFRCSLINYDPKT